MVNIEDRHRTVRGKRPLQSHPYLDQIANQSCSFANFVCNVAEWLGLEWTDKDEFICWGKKADKLSKVSWDALGIACTGKRYSYSEPAIAHARKATREKFKDSEQPLSILALIVTMQKYRHKW